jgi:hypothetical protein
VSGDRRFRGITLAVSEDGTASVLPFLGGLAELQATIGGNVDAAPTHESVTFWVHDEGKFQCLPVNWLAIDCWLRYDQYGCVLLGGDYLAGTVVVSGGVGRGGETLDIPADVRVWITRVAADAGVPIDRSRPCRKCGQPTEFAAAGAPGTGGGWYCASNHYESA